MRRKPDEPPPLARWILERGLPRDLCEPFLGDLEEAFCRDVLPSKGPAAARRWYWRETLRAPLGFSSLPATAPAPTTRQGDSPMSIFIGDVRFALRMARRNPAFTALVTLTLAVGIGATTAIFSAVYPILFAPLPYANPDGLVMISERGTDGLSAGIGFTTFHDIAEADRTFSSMAAIGDWQATMTGNDEPERIEGQRVSPSYFSVLGVRPAMGRDFQDADDVPNSPRVAILSHGLWRRRFGGDAAIIGRTIVINGNPYSVLGVMPASFENVIEPKAQLWTTLRYSVSLPYACRTCHHLQVVGRLKPGVSPRAAAAELDGISRRLVAEHPTEYAAPGMLMPSLREQMTRGVKPALLAVLAAVLLLLLIACANVTLLLLARAAQRQGEFAVRAALGARRGRMLRQLLAESALLAAAGGALGIAAATLGVRVLVGMSPPNLPRLGAIAVNAPVLAFALSVTTVVGLVFGVVPALHGTRADLQGAFQRSSRRTPGTRRLTRASLVISEVALALMLLVGSGLLVRSMRRVLSMSAGFDTSHLATMQVQTSGIRFRNDTVTRAFFDEVLAAVRSIPGVEAAALTSQLPLSTDSDQYGVHLERHPSANSETDPSASRYAVSPGYIEMMRIPVRRGRAFIEADRTDGRPVAMVSESFARRLFGADDPIGQRLRVGAADQGAWREVVGVVGDVKQLSLEATGSDGVYLPEAQWQWADGAMSLAVRTRGEPLRLVPAVRRAIWSVDKDQPIVRIASMEQLVDSTAAERRFTMVLFEAFGAVALLLAAAGIYGVLSGSVTERRREIGVRAALGASRANILAIIVRQGLGLTGVGLAVGLVAAVGLSRFIDGLLFGVSTVDPATYALVTGLLFLVALVACSIPAARAARTDPMETLRAD